MRIKNLQLQNFKRFTDLSIFDVPETAKLVLVIGSNGSGKSSLFDAFDWISKGANKGNPYGAGNYYSKDPSFDPLVKLDFWTEESVSKKGANMVPGHHQFAKRLIGRSSIRIVPRITNSANPSQVESDYDSPSMYIENDTRFINDVHLYIQEINKALREPVFSGKQADTLKIFQDFIDPLNQSLLRIFGGDDTTTIQIAEFEDSTPHSAAKLFFKKGSSKINYDLLSHGEKQVVILLINFIVRKQFYENSIIFIDEMDCHLNTALQASLIEEIVATWIPESAQLWTASHALGFIDHAKNSDNSAIIDFDLLNFDSKQVICPSSREKLDVYEVALPKSTIASILKGYKLVVVENRNDEYFNAALGEDSYLFLPADNSREVFLTCKGDVNKLGLRDRDYLRQDEIEQIQQKVPNLKILDFYTFENYIYHPDNLGEIGLKGFNRDEYIKEILKQKNEKLIEIVSEIGVARSHYVEFKECIRNDGNLKPFNDSLKSEVFEEYYPFFNMKKHFNKLYLNKFRYNVLDLAKTKWFKKAILEILNK